MLARAELLPFANVYMCRTEHARPIYALFWCDKMHLEDWVMTLFTVMDYLLYVRQVTSFRSYHTVMTFNQWLPERSISSKIEVRLINLNT